MDNLIFGICIHYLMPRGKNMFKTESYMAMEKCVHIHHENIHYHIGNFCCDVVHNVYILITQLKNQISRIHMLFLQYIFLCITYFQVVLHMVDAFSMKKQCQFCESTYDSKLTEINICN